jgi:hypothetical protein
LLFFLCFCASLFGLFTWGRGLVLHMLQICEMPTKIWKGGGTFWLLS